MLKLSTKSWIFLFLIIFVVWLSASFFVKNYKLLGFINSKDYTASLAGDFIAPEIEKNQEEPISKDLVADETPVVLAESEKQNLLDDIQEKIDLIKQEVLELEKSLNPEGEQKLEEQRAGEKEEPENKLDDENRDEQNNQEKTKKITQKSSSIGKINIIYPKILISEVQTAGQDDEKQEFVELYNPNNENIDLTGWYLQRKTASSQSWSTYAPNNLFSGKIIGPNGYFLIAREGYYSGSNDIFTDNAITPDNSFAFKNPNGEISDKLGFGLANDFETSPAENPAEGKSLGRKFDQALQAYLDTDNNSADFELNTPTPHSKNVKYTAPVENPPEPVKNILINEIQINPIGRRFVELYNPNNFLIDLTGWYIQRKTQNATSWGSFVTSANFENKIIGSNDYFLISREIEDSDIVLGITLSDNNSLALKNQKREIIDQSSWEDVLSGKSIGRNSENIFVIFDVPTPRKENKY